MQTRLGYVLLGGCGGLFFVFFALGVSGIAKLGLWPPVLGMVSGGILGAIMYETRHWDANGAAGSLLRWICGLAIAALVLSLIAASFRAIPFAGVPAAVGLGLLSGLGFGLEVQYRPISSGDGSRKRTGLEIEDLWLVILGTIALAVALFATTWALTR